MKRLRDISSRRRFLCAGMTLIEVTLALGLTLAIVYVATVQLRVQEEVWWQLRRMEFYTREMPRMARALHTLSMQGQTFYVTSDQTTMNGVPEGKAIVVMVRDRDEAVAPSPNLIFFDEVSHKIKYRNTNGDIWYLAQNVKKCIFSMNPDATVTVFVDNGFGIGAEFVIERM